MAIPQHQGDEALLDNPVWHALTGPHADFARRAGAGDNLFVRYDAAFSPFAAARRWDDPRVWDAAIQVLGPGETVLVTGDVPSPPTGWGEVRGVGVQLVETERLEAWPDSEAIELGAADVHEMLDLVGRAKPGPFDARTHELGRYIGFRVDGALVAMAGERMHPAGWTEISAVATDDRFRRRGLASRLVRHLVHGIRARGERALIHATVDNTSAITGYEKLGFVLRRTPDFVWLRTPGERGSGEGGHGA